MQRFFAVLLLILMAAGSVRGQVGIGTNTPDASSVLELQSSSAGLLPPRLTTTQRNAITAPATGLMIYNLSSNRLEAYDGTNWVAAGPDADWNTSPAGVFNATDSVGIGTSTKLDQRLTVVDTFQGVPDSAGVMAFFHGQTNGTPANGYATGIGLAADRGDNDGRPGTKLYDVLVSGAGTNGDRHGFGIDVREDDDFRTALRILEDGKVGIGLKEPDARLHLGDTANGFSNTQEARVESQGYAGLRLVGDRDNNGASETGGAFLSLEQDGGSVRSVLSTIQQADDDGMGGSYTNTRENSVLLGNRYNGPLHLGTDGAVRMTVDENGRVGIGTNTPKTNGILTLDGNLVFRNGTDATIGFPSPVTANSGGNITIRAQDVPTSGSCFSGNNVNIIAGHRNTAGCNNSGGDILLRAGGNSFSSFVGEGEIIIETQNGTTPVERLRITDQGNVGIGTNSPGALLQVGTNGDGSVALANSWTSLSDRRLKTDLQELQSPLASLAKLNSYTYRWKDGADLSEQIGLVAQEVNEVYPQVVSETGDGYLSVDYSKLVAPLIAGVNELQQENAKLRRENAEMKRRLRRLEAAVGLDESQAGSGVATTAAER